MCQTKVFLCWNEKGAAIFRARHWWHVRVGRVFTKNEQNPCFFWAVHWTFKKTRRQKRQTDTCVEPHRTSLGSDGPGGPCGPRGPDSPDSPDGSIPLALRFSSRSNVVVSEGVWRLIVRSQTGRKSVPKIKKIYAAELILMAVHRNRAACAACAACATRKASRLVSTRVYLAV